ncbi:MAG TPA: MFS transporter, partial [Candidatus Binatia bacterium]
METATRVSQLTKQPGIFYGWYIVGVGFLANVASSFALASTLSIFLKPLTAELGISRGVFSLLRSGEGIIAACLAPLVGALVDRYGGRWLMVAGTVIVGVGYFFLSHVENFAQFAGIRLTLVAFGDCMMGYMVVNVVISRWFVRRRGRALAFSSMGVGFAKVCMPIVAAWLLLLLGWRQTWFVFGIVTMVLLALPALLVIRRTPEEMGLLPDGAREPVINNSPSPIKKPSSDLLTRDTDAAWTRAEALRTSAFWLLVITFGISSVGVTGLNLHVYSYVTDLGQPAVIAASVMSVIASMQLASPLAWGLLVERIDARYAATL